MQRIFNAVATITDDRVKAIYALRLDAQTPNDHHTKVEKIGELDRHSVQLKAGLAKFHADLQNR